MLGGRLHASNSQNNIAAVEGMSCMKVHILRVPGSEPTCFNLVYTTIPSNAADVHPKR